MGDVMMRSTATVCWTTIELLHSVPCASLQYNALDSRVLLHGVVLLWLAG